MRCVNTGGTLDAVVVKTSSRLALVILELFMLSGFNNVLYKAVYVELIVYAGLVNTRHVEISIKD
jgi:hypothetical protein